MKVKVTFRWTDPSVGLVKGQEVIVPAGGVPEMRDAIKAACLARGLSRGAAATVVNEAMGRYQEIEKITEVKAEIVP